MGPHLQVNFFKTVHDPDSFTALDKQLNHTSVFKNRKRDFGEEKLLRDPLWHANYSSKIPGHFKPYIFFLSTELSHFDTSIIKLDSELELIKESSLLDEAITCASDLL